ncbi:hypothetical protein BDV18DRAFT_119211 [Aspergillus unguis]
MPGRSSLSLRTSLSYPSTVLDVSDANLKALIEVLVTTPPKDAFPYFSTNDESHIQQAIKKLPSDLRRRSSIFSLSSTITPAATLCTAHKGFNQYVTENILRLIKREVEEHLELIVKWLSPDLLDPAIVEVVRCLRSLRGLWWDHDSGHIIPSGLVRTQQNKCEACMISRVITNYDYLQNLRAALKSRTRKRCSYRPPPKLLRVVQQAMNLRRSNSSQLLSGNGLELAVGLKEARKYAADRKRLHSHGCDHNCIPRDPHNSMISETPSSIRAPVSAPGRRPSSQTVMFCLLHDIQSPLFKPLPELPTQDEDEIQGEQDQMILDIINAYGPWTPTLTNHPQRLCTPPPSDPNDSGNDSKDSPSERSDWEDNWEESSISVISPNYDVSQLIDQISDLLIDNADLAEIEPRTSASRRKVTVVSPTISCPMATLDHPERGLEPKRRGVHLETGSRIKPPGRRDGSEATTWSQSINVRHDDGYITRV